MISFMLISAPRCGSSWASNWLTTDATLCLHDPLYTRHYEDLDSIISGKTLGIACTGIAHFHKWANQHSSRKVVLHRPLDEINLSLDAIGLPPIDVSYLDNLHRIEALHADWTDLFDRPKPIYEHLTGLPFDAERHALLKEIEMQPNFATLKVGREVTARLVNEIRESVGA